jgi:hypothetical protein
VQGLLYAMPENILAPQGSIQLTLDKALDERLYDLTEEERTFFKQQTGIQGDDELRAHIFQVQAEAYEVCMHPWTIGVTSTGNEIHETLSNKTGFSLHLHSPLPFRKVSSLKNT